MTGSSSARAGLLVRTSLDADAPYIAMWMSPTKVIRESRLTTGGTVEFSGVSAPMPRWLKITRQGNVFSAFHSSDGTTWTQRGSATLTGGSGTVYAGVALCSGSGTATASASGYSLSIP